MEFNFVFKSK